ncbi:MAG: hypothetical protein CMK07_10485 [Ponticaulis sp.]|nr:hypothetical protein [Ponticaulis sp.]
MSAERTLTNFVRALRSADVRVSTGETLDAVQVVKLIGYSDKSVLKTSLRAVLAKSNREKQAYDRLFDLYFSQGQSKAADSETSTKDDNESGSEDGYDGFLDLATSGDDAAIDAALARAGQEVGLEDIRFSTQVGYYSQKMLKAMGVEEMETTLLERLQDHSPEGDADAEVMIDARKNMTTRALEYARTQFDIYGEGATQQFREDFLSKKRINEMDVSDLNRMKPLVEKLARRLATKHSRRRRRKNRGQIDLRRTLRANAGRDGVPFDVHWRQKKKDRPKIILICDVSNSVARYVRFLLLFLYCMQDVVKDLHTFAFSARLKDVGEILDTSLDGFEQAMEKVMHEAGWGSTDYGQALSDLFVDHWSLIDRKTTLIILGDARSNHGDPRLDLFEEATARAKRTVWLNPESRALWGSGDSEMLRYFPHCSVVSGLSTLKDLERAVDDVLTHYR